MKRRSSVGLAFLLAVSTVVVSAIPALAIGDITGNVTDELSGLAVEGICVEAHDDITEGTILGSDLTDALGDYSIAALADGDYRLRFYDPDLGICGTEATTPEWTGEWWDDVADHASATTVTIAAANEARDAILTGTGIVDGTPNDGTIDLACVHVYLYDADTAALLDSQNTAGDSNYSFSGLITGVNYTLRFQSSGGDECTLLAGEWHGGIPIQNDTARHIDAADTFTVAAGATVTIDPTLEEFVTITGTMVSERTGDPIEGATLRLYPRSSAGPVSSDWIEVQTSAAGVFVWDNTVGLDLVVANTYGYKIQAENYNDSNGLRWELEWWLDMDNTGAATEVDTETFAGGTVDLDIDALFDRHGPGAITGTVTDEGSGLAIEGVTVNLYDDAGVIVLATDTSAADGTYDLGEMDPADYDVEFVAAGYDSEWNTGDPDSTIGATTVIASEEGVLTVNILNAVLGLADGSISGTLTEDGSGDPISGATVTLYTAAGAFEDATTTAADGTYAFSDVAATEHDLEFTATGYVTEWYDDAANAVLGSVSVGGAEAVVADASLALSDGSISGTVTDDFSGDPIAGATVTLNTAAGVLVATTTTAADGSYAFPDLAAAEYDLEFTATGYFSEWYDNAANATVGSVTVGAEEAVVADAALTLNPGSISGTLSVLGDTLGGQFAAVTVEVYSDGTLIGSAAVAGDGTFTVGGLIAGTYTVLASTGPAENPDTFFSAWYVSAPLFVTDDASDVVVGAGVDITGIDITLQPLFVDVLSTNLFFADIVWMQESGITLGCQIDAYCPDDLVTRGQMATFLVRALGLAPDTTDYFTDDDGSTHEANINALRGAGITFGCGIDAFCPNDLVTRAQMASFIVRAMGYAISTVDYFTDDDGNAHEGNINTLRENDVTLGCDVDSYCPNDDVRRDHMAAFLHRALGD